MHSYNYWNILALVLM